jgi:pyruvate dehydrogenase E1 component beta subunit
VSSVGAEVRDRILSVFIAEAIEAEMRRDERILVLGEDVGAMGGVYGATRNLQRHFGDRRVRDTPIAEMSFTGMAVGLAMAGYRPLVEIMFTDFIGVCLEQVYNAAAKVPYMSGGRVRMPIVFKTAAGCEGSAAQHSQCLWGMLGHLPGLRVVAPANPFDSKGMMAAALRCDDPVIFMEHKRLLVRKAGDFSSGSAVPAEPYVVPLDEAAVVRRGSDVSVATLSATVEAALEAAKAVAAEGIDAEVIDLRSVVPLDMETVCESVQRTQRLLIVDEDYLSFGLTGELVARVLEKLGPSGLRAFARHAVPDVPIPASLPLEQAVLPHADSIARALRMLVVGA